MLKVYQLVCGPNTVEEVLGMGTAPFPFIILKKSPQGGRKNPEHAYKKGMLADNTVTAKAPREELSSVAGGRSQDRLKGNGLRSAKDQITLGLGAKFMLTGHGKVYSDKRLDTSSLT